MCSGKTIRLYCQDESRFGLKTHIGRCLTAKGIKPVSLCSQAFKSTYLYGCFSPQNGDYFFWEIDGVSKDIFITFLEDFSNHKPEEHKIILIDNAGFHSTKDVVLPSNITLVNIPPYTPELNPAERVWQYLKQRFKNQVFNDMTEIRTWLYDQIELLNKDLIQSITHHQGLLNPLCPSN